MIIINRDKLLSVAMSVLFAVAALLIGYSVFTKNMRYALPSALIFMGAGNIVRYFKLKQSGAENIKKSLIISVTAIVCGILMLIPANF